MSEFEVDGERPVAAYEPFPGFGAWAQVAFDSSAFDAFAALLESDKASASADQLKDAVETATRWAAIDTGAIEGLYEVDRGFTLSVAASAQAWQNIGEAKGESVRRAIEDALAGYEFVLDVATGREPVTEVWIKQLHATLCASQQTYRVMTDQGWQDQQLPKGDYKQHSNSPLNLQSDEIHSYASPHDTPPEMARLVSELRSEAFESAHPVLQAAYAHYAFVCVHPFADGNGRVSRALASAFLYRSPGVPLVIFADQKAEYIDALEAADAGNPLPFVNFVSERAIDTIGMVRAGLRRASGPSIDERLRQFSAILAGRGGFPHAEVDDIALRLRERVAGKLSDLSMGTLRKSSFEVGLNPRAVSPEPTIPDGFRWPRSVPAILLELKAPAPAGISCSVLFAVLVSVAGRAGPDFAISAGGRVIADAALSEVTPTVSKPFEYRLDLAIEDEVVSLIGEVTEATKVALENGGYLPPATA